jgi:phosphohistidine phosphatase
MKELLVLRHAKSDWSDPLTADIDRPLNDRGKRDSRRLGQLLRDEDLLPDVILTSPAKRARKTVERLTAAGSYAGKVKEESGFYPGGPDDYVRGLSGLQDKYQRVMVVGHNPGLESLLERLTGTDEVLPTAAIARVALPIDHWRDLKAETRGRLTGIWRPRELA